VADDKVFWIFGVNLVESGGISGFYNGFLFFLDDDVASDGPTCDMAIANKNLLMRSTDVSGNKKGLRLVGDVLDPDIMEWNGKTADLGHYSKLTLQGRNLIAGSGVCTW
jgi:hypothetical protein